MKNKGILIPVIAIVIAAAVLFGANAGLAGLREENVQAERLSRMQTLLPGSETFTEEPYTGEDAAVLGVYKAENGYVIEVEQ